MFEMIVGIATIAGTLFAVLAYLHSQKRKRNNERAEHIEEKSKFVLPTVKVKRIKENVLDALPRLISGKEVLNIIDGADACSYDHEEVNQEEAKIISDFLKELDSFGILGSDCDPGFKVELSAKWTDDIKNLENAGFYVFGAREKQLLEGNEQITSWLMGIIRIYRKNSNNVVKISKEEMFNISTRR